MHVVVVPLLVKVVVRDVTCTEMLDAASPLATLCYLRD